MLCTRSCVYSEGRCSCAGASSPSVAHVGILNQYPAALRCPCSDEPISIGRQPDKTTLYLHTGVHALYRSGSGAGVSNVFQNERAVLWSLTNTKTITHSFRPWPATGEKLQSVQRSPIDQQHLSQPDTLPKYTCIRILYDP